MNTEKDRSLLTVRRIRRTVWYYPRLTYAAVALSVSLFVSNRLHILTPAHALHLSMHGKLMLDVWTLVACAASVAVMSVVCSTTLFRKGQIVEHECAHAVAAWFEPLLRVERIDIDRHAGTVYCSYPYRVHPNGVAMRVDVARALIRMLLVTSAYEWRAYGYATHVCRFDIREAHRLARHVAATSDKSVDDVLNEELQAADRIIIEREADHARLVRLMRAQPQNQYLPRCIRQALGRQIVQRNAWKT